MNNLRRLPKVEFYPWNPLASRSAVTAASQRANCADISFNQHRSVSIDRCKDSLHLVPDIRMIALFFRLVFAATHLVNPGQLSFARIDPFPASDLAIALVLDVNPFF